MYNMQYIYILSMQSTLCSDKPLQLQWWRWRWWSIYAEEDDHETTNDIHNNASHDLTFWEVKGSKGPKIWDRLRCVTWSFLGSIWTWRALRLSPQWLPRGMVQSVQSKLGVSRWRKWNFPLSMFYLKFCILRFDIHISVFSGDSIPLKTTMPFSATESRENVMMILAGFLHVDFMLHLLGASVFASRLYGWGPCLNPSTCSFNVPWHWMSGIGIIHMNPGCRTTQEETVF